jgi:hypothetical protein
MTTDDTQPKLGPSVIERLGRLIFGAPQTDEHSAVDQLIHLTEAIAAAPDEPGNYILRGELYLALRQVEAAKADFEQAYTLALAQVESDDWGLAAQVNCDRALLGLEAVSRLR